MKKTAFTEKHIALGAKMHAFAGYNMPIEYSGITDEHLCVRNAVGVFDVSHMGEFWVKGPGALDYLQKITSNDVSILSPGKAQYSCFPNGKGGIVDDLLVYAYDHEKYMLVVNAANIEKDWNWCIENKIDGVDLENASDNMAQLAIQGPKATAILQTLTKVKLDDIPYYEFTTGNFADFDEVIISNTGYTGAGGFELYFSPEKGEQIWDAIFQAGAADGIKAIGLGARDTLRLEKGFCLYGNDIDDSTSPIEAGLGWITKFTDTKEFIDKDLLSRQKAEKPTRRLRGFVLQVKGIPRSGYSIVDADGNKIGHVTSGTMSPMMKQGIGLGYVETARAGFGSEIFIEVRNKKLPATIVKLPFYKD